MGEIHVNSCFSVFHYIVNFCSVVLALPKSLAKGKKKSLAGLISSTL